MKTAAKVPPPAPYKTQLSLNERKVECARVLKKYPDRIPVVCERSPKSSASLPYSAKIKYLIPRDLTLAQFIYIIRKQINMSAEQAIFMVINGKIMTCASMMSALYEKYHDPDGFLYITYTGENTFGAGAGATP
jgi:GABA(A) receptor-associated protein